MTKLHVAIWHHQATILQYVDMSDSKSISLDNSELIHWHWGNRMVARVVPVM